MNSTPLGTRIDEIADGIYRLSTGIPPPTIPGGFSFNQYLVLDDEPLLFHTGPRRLFTSTCDAIARVLPPENLRWIAYSHFEQDECGAMNEFLAVAPRAEVVCSAISAMTCADDLATRPPRPLRDGEILRIGRHELTWFDAPHVPHGWDCGFLSESTTGTLLCGDLFTQPGADHAPVTTADVLGPSEALRKMLDYWSHAPSTRATLERLAATQPRTLACMHGAAWSGDGARLIRELAGALES